MRTDSVKEVGSTAGSTMSAGTSIASSECSDEACVEYDGDSDSLFAVSEDQDYLNSSFYNVLDVNAIPGIIFCCTFQCVCIATDEQVNNEEHDHNLWAFITKCVLWLIIIV